MPSNTLRQALVAWRNTFDLMSLPCGADDLSFYDKHTINCGRGLKDEMTWIMKNYPSWLIMLLILYALMCAYLLMSVFAESAMPAFPLSL